MRSRIVAVAILLLMVPTSPAAQWAVDRHDTADDRAHKVVDGFGAYLVLIPAESSLDEDYAFWDTEKAPPIPMLDHIAPGERFKAVVLYGGCGKRETDCNPISIEYCLYRPDDTLYGTCATTSTPTGVKRVAGRTYVAREPLLVAFTATDVAGRYRVKARVRDEGRAITVELEAVIMLDGVEPYEQSPPN